MQFTYLHKVFIGVHVDIMELFQHRVHIGSSIMMNDGTSRSAKELMKKWNFSSSQRKGNCSILIQLDLSTFHESKLDLKTQMKSLITDSL